jgi:hypothetical protein
MICQVGGMFTMTFQSASAVWNYQPSAGVPAPLNANHVDPISTASGQFGGEVVALKLNVDFADAGHISESGEDGSQIPVPFGSLTLCGLASPYESLNGTSVRSFLATANVAIGGGATKIPIADLNWMAIQLNASFENGSVSQVAQDHLFNGTCPCTPGAPGCGWQDGDVVTYVQADWGDPTTAAGILLNNYFNVLYGAVGYVEVGIPGTGGYSMFFTSAAAVFTYQPASGAQAPLNADLVDPTSTASGIFGGEVLALRFNIDLSDADFLAGTTNIEIGNLTLCGLVQTALNGTTVRAFQDIANTALGGGSTPYAIADLSAIARNINSAFTNGAVTVFAQDHLFNGPCP